MANILVVDDNLLIRSTLNRILTELGHRVVGEATNGNEAILKYEQTQPDLVTMDITMPDLDGIDAVRELIKRYPNAKIIMISAISQRELVFQAVMSGAKHYIIKPIKAEKVAEVVNLCLKM
jgi:two-component system chemotaxis response regulator CheY